MSEAFVMEVPSVILAGEPMGLFIAQEKGPLEEVSNFDAGAQAIVSPGINPGVVSWCIHENPPVIPSCATSTEIEFCRRYGLKAVKCFRLRWSGASKC